MTLELDFHAAIEDVDVYGINEYLGVSKDIDIDCGKPTVYIDYELQPEVRDWGIKSISVIIKKVVAQITWETEKEGGYTEINSNEQLNGKKWNIDCEVTFEEDGALSINSVAIHLDYMTITIS